MIPSITSDNLFRALGDLLTTIAPAGTEIVRGQQNRVPMPASDSFIVMTEAQRQQNAQTTHDYDPEAGSNDIGRSTTFRIQVDVYGAAAGDTAQAIVTLLRDAYGFDFLKPHGVAPLYCEDPTQMPLIAGEQQYIQRWTIRVLLHANVAISTSQDFADTLITTLKEYP
jgi:hypothetical protein